MVNSASIYLGILRRLVKTIGRLRPEPVEIEPGTVIHFWVPTKPDQTKPSLVFLHCFAFNGILTWQFQVLSSSLSRNHNIYVPDFLFFGDSVTDSDDDRSSAFQGECIAKALVKLGVERCTLVCNSYGGILGFPMAATYPDLVDSMVVSASVMVLTESASRSALEKIRFTSWDELLLPTSVKGLKETLDRGTANPLWLPDFCYKHMIEVLIVHRKERSELLKAMVIRDEDFTIPQLRQRIHLLWGESDKIFGLDVAGDIVEKLKGKATLHCIKKAGHLVHFDRPCVYNRHLKKILTSLYPQDCKGKNSKNCSSLLLLIPNSFG